MAPRKQTTAVALAVPDETQAQATVERLLSLNRVLDIALPEQTEEKWRYVAHLENEAAVNMAKRGFVYLMLKEEVGHGQFLKELEDRGVPQRSAYNAMAVARMLGALPPAKVKALSHVASSKLIELAKVPVETLEEMEAQGSLELDEVDTMSVRDLKHHLRRTRQELEKRDMQLGHLQEAQAEAQARAKKPAYPPLVMEVRQESAALSEQARLALDDMEHLLARLENPLEAAQVSAVDFGVAATTLYHQVRASYGQALRLMHIVQQQLGAHTAMELEELPAFLEDELAQWRFAREVIVGEHRTQAETRAMSRSMGDAQPRRRGRPKGSKNKNKGKS